MANTLAAPTRLQQTYNPVNIATVRDVDASRREGERNSERSNRNGKCNRGTQKSVVKGKYNSLNL